MSVNVAWNMKGEEMAELSGWEHALDAIYSNILIYSIHVPSSEGSHKIEIVFLNAVFSYLLVPIDFRMVPPPPPSLTAGPPNLFTSGGPPQMPISAPPVAALAEVPGIKPSPAAVLFPPAGQSPLQPPPPPPAHLGIKPAFVSPVKVVTPPPSGQQQQQPASTTSTPKQVCVILYTPISHTPTRDCTLP